jgi:hypothetical protein
VCVCHHVIVRGCCGVITLMRSDKRLSVPSTRSAHSSRSSLRTVPCVYDVANARAQCVERIVNIDVIDVGLGLTQDAGERVSSTAA